MKTLKFFTLITFCSLTFTGCFGGTSGEESVQGKITYQTDNFIILVPESWEALGKSDFTSNIPSNIVAAFRNNIQNEIFTANLTISEDILEEEITSEDFGKSSLAQAKNTLISYREISREEIQIISGEESLNSFIVEFEGKRNNSEPLIRFKQTYAINDGIGYIITGSFLQTENENVVKTIDEMLNSFALE